MRRRVDLRIGLLSWALGSMIALAASVTVLAAPAQADEADRHYYEILLDMGAANIDFPLARQQGLESCVMLDSGYTMAQTVDDLVRAGPYSVTEASGMTAAAIMAFCPWNDPR